MSSEKELVFVAGHRPIYSDKIRYYKEKQFMEKISPPPLYSDTATAIKSYADLFKIHAAERRKIEEKRLAVEKARQAEEGNSAGKAKGEMPHEERVQREEIAAQESQEQAGQKSRHDTGNQEAPSSESEEALVKPGASMKDPALRSLALRIAEETVRQERVQADMERKIVQPQTGKESA